MKHTPAILPASVRRAVDDWIARGCTVVIEPTGAVKVTPPSVQVDDLDLIDFKVKR